MSRRSQATMLTVRGVNARGERPPWLSYPVPAKALMQSSNNGFQVVFSMRLSSASVPAAAAFNVRVNGVQDNTITVGVPSTGAYTGTLLIMLTNAAPAGVPILVSYTPPGVNNLEAFAYGNDAPAFTNLSVPNP